MHAHVLVCLLAIALVGGCAGGPSVNPERSAEAQAFLDDYTETYLALYYEAAEAEWALNTRIAEGDSSNANEVERTAGALADFTGSSVVIERTRELLRSRKALEPIQVRQLERILYTAANNPGTVPDLVKERIAAEAAQTEALFGYDFKIADESVTTNAIDEILRTETDIDKRLEAWEASKQVGTVLKDGLENLVRLRNETVRALGYDNYFHYQVSDYGMSVDEMMDMMEQFMRETRPLYRELHTWARYELAEKYGQAVPDLLPAHWLPNRWAQTWSPMIDVEGFDLDAALEPKGAAWLVEQAERFYVSLGFDPLPESFWEKSSLYPLPADAEFKKNNHASAWHLDLQDDVRCLMSVEPNRDWYETTHHELGHIYYYVAYTNPDVPPLLREGANRAFHEAIGSLLGLASMQKAFIQEIGLLHEDAETDEIRALLKEALDFIVFIPFSSGVMTHFERDLYATDLSKDDYNKQWWAYAKKFQGVVPPNRRSVELCDAATKTHINDDAAQYYDYAISFVLLHQFHAHIANEILDQNPRNTNYFGNREVGYFLHDVLSLGATRDWRRVMREFLGEGVSAEPMLEYFAPLMDWLKEQNRGRTATLPEL